MSVIRTKVLIVIFILSTNSVGFANLRSSGNLIYGGQTIKHSDPSWKHVIGYEIFYKNGSNGSCSGTLYDSYKLVTAAHCLLGQISGIEINYYRGSRIIRSKYYGKKSFDLLSHPNYSRHGYDYDIGVIRFNKSIIPSKLGHRAVTVLTSKDIRAFHKGLTGYLMGTGDSSKTGRSGFLYHITATLAYFARSTQAVFSPGRGKAVCGGDSGGALMIKNKAGKLRFAGVIIGTRARTAHCVPGAYAVTTLIGDTLHKWIERL